MIDRRALLVVFVFGTVFVTALVARGLELTEELRLVLLIWQQLLFAIGGILGSRKVVMRLPSLGMLAWGVLGGAGLYVGNLMGGALSRVLAVKLLSETAVQQLILRERAGQELLLTSERPLIAFGMMLLVIIGAPLAEELFFRGLLLDLWKQRRGTICAVFGAALFFAVLHFSVLQFFPVLISGLILGILFVRFDNIYIPIIAHSVTNGLILLVWLMGL